MTIIYVIQSVSSNNPNEPNTEYMFGDLNMALKKIEFLKNNHLAVSESIGEHPHKNFEILEYTENKNKEFIYKKILYNTSENKDTKQEKINIENLKDYITLEDLDNTPQDLFPICVYCDQLIDDNNNSGWSTTYGKRVCLDCFEKNYDKNINTIITNKNLLLDIPKEYLEKAIYIMKADIEDENFSEKTLKYIKEIIESDMYWPARIDIGSIIKKFPKIFLEKIGNDIDWESCCHQIFEKVLEIERNSPIE